MGRMKKISYSLETRSSLSLSPRAQNGFYRGIDFKMEDINAIASLDGMDADSVKIIFPFYQYGIYERYEPKEVQYYIPGSSIKGAIGETTLRVDDVKLSWEDLQLRNLFKVQYAAVNFSVVKRCTGFCQRLINLQSVNRSSFLGSWKIFLT